MAKNFSIVFALFPNLTQLDFTGPFEVLKRLPGSEVIVASRQGGQITADSGLTFAGLAKLSEVARCDLICVPGGYGVSAALRDAELVREVRRLGLSARYVTSVCSGSLLLAAAGLIQGKRAACHWAWRELLAEAGVDGQAERVVRDGNVITGGGVTAGIDFALTLVAELAGEHTAREIQLAIEYDPQPPFDCGSPEKAPPEVRDPLRERLAQMYPERKAALQAALAVTKAAIRPPK